MEPMVILDFWTEFLPRKFFPSKTPAQRTVRLLLGALLFPVWLAGTIPVGFIALLCGIAGLCADYINEGGDQ